MVKTPKKAAPGGDERNLYNRRLKATTAPSNPSETSLHKRQCESEIANRSKLATLQKRIPPGPKKSLKSKIGVPIKPDANRPMKHPSKPRGASREKQLMVTEKGEESCSSKMQPEPEEAEVKPDSSVQKEDTKIEVSLDIQETDKEHVDHVAPVPVPKLQEESLEKEASAERVRTESEEKICVNAENAKEVEEHEENDLILTFESDQSAAKVQEEKTDDRVTAEEAEEKCPAAVAAVKNGVHEKEDVQSESQTDTDSLSADTLEFTTSGMSDASETVSQTDASKEKENVAEDIKKDISFVSYDPAIMLKDVQIKLNDCLKDNSKLFDTSNAGPDSSSQAAKEVSYGKTLRSISGRRSLSRMRHVTVREHRYSPNDSLFVNTSSISLPPEDMADYKILRYSTGPSDVLSTTNGSPGERKRKHDTDEWNSSKKQKTEAENSLLNSSISLLKGLRRPIQVSTPVAELKFQPSKLDLDDEAKSANEATKKWCVIM